jgi:hypothetical protein
MNESTIWDMTDASEQEQRKALAALSGDGSWIPQRTAPKKIEVFVQDFCTYCGKHRNTALIRMQHGFSWYCLPCQLRYRLKVFIGKFRRRQ